MRTTNSLMVIGFIQLMHIKFMLVRILWYSDISYDILWFYDTLFSLLIFLVTCFQQLNEWKLINIQLVLCATETVKLGTIHAALPYQFTIRKWKCFTEVPFCSLGADICKFSDFSVFVTSQTFPLDSHNQIFIRNI